jgi:hypothetical protein
MQDGRFAVPGLRYWDPKKAIDVVIGDYTIWRKEGSNLLKISHAEGRTQWFHFEDDVCRKWHCLTPSEFTTNAVPPEPHERSRVMVSLERAFIGFGYGLRNAELPRL